MLQRFQDSGLYLIGARRERTCLLEHKILNTKNSISNETVHEIFASVI